MLRQGTASHATFMLALSRLDLPAVVACRELSYWPRPCEARHRSLARCHARGLSIATRDRWTSSRLHRAVLDILETAVAEKIHAIEAVEDLLVVRDGNDGRILLAGEFAQQVHHNLGAL